MSSRDLVECRRTWLAVPFLQSRLISSLLNAQLRGSYFPWSGCSPSITWGFEVSWGCREVGELLYKKSLISQPAAGCCSTGAAESWCRIAPG